MSGWKGLCIAVAVAAAGGNAVAQGTLTTVFNDVHNYPALTYNLGPGGESAGEWMPDMRALEPSIVLDADPRVAYLHSLYGPDPSGGWTLFLTDLDIGEKGTSVNWSPIIAAIPEPSAGAFVCLGAAAFLIHSSNNRRGSLSRT
jgi:hypothetical protein